MIVTTVTAHCDREGCENTQALSDADTQRYRTLVEMGWTNALVGDDILIYCPKCSS